MDGRIARSRLGWPGVNMVDERLNEQLDACRADTDDLRQPELATLAEYLADHPEERARLQRVQQFDVAVRRALDHVALPPGLAARVSAAMVAAEGQLPAVGARVDQAVGVRVDQAVGVLVDQAVAAEGPKPGEATLGTPNAEPVSRGWLAVGTIAAATLAILALYAPAQSYSREDVLEAAAQFLKGDLLLDSGDGVLLTDRAPKGFPFSDLVMRGPHVRWEQRDFLGHKGVVYRLTPAGGAQKPACLVVVKLHAPPHRLAISSPLPGMPGKRPFSTGGMTSDCWQSAGYLYVLVVDGDETRFQSFLRTVQPVA